MVNYNFEAVFIDEKDQREIDRTVVDYDPKLEVGDIFRAYNEQIYKITSKQKIIDTIKDKIYYVYFVNDSIEGVDYLEYILF